MRLQLNQSHVDRLLQPIDFSVLTLRIETCLKNTNIRHYLSVFLKGERGLLRIPNFSHKSLNSLRAHIVTKFDLFPESNILTLSGELIEKLPTHNSQDPEVDYANIEQIKDVLMRNLPPAPEGSSLRVEEGSLSIHDWIIGLLSPELRSGLSSAFLEQAAIEVSQDPEIRAQMKTSIEGIVSQQLGLTANSTPESP